MTESVTLAEYESRVLQLDEMPAAHVRERLADTLGPRLELDWLADRQVRVRSGPWVGVVRLPDGRSIRIVPKLAGDELRVLYLVGLVSGLTDAELVRLQRSLSTAPRGDLLDLVCSLLVGATSDVMTRGPLRDYRPAEGDLPFMRGRLDVVRQATRHLGRVDVLACRYESFDHDILDNRLLKEAVARAAAVSTDSTVRRRARQLHEDLLALAPGPCPRPVDAARMLQYDRRNEGYRTAHAWALVLLANESIVRPFDDTGRTGDAFLINMNQLFERFVTWLFRRIYAGTDTDVRSQHKDRSLLWHRNASWGGVVPDILLRRQDRRLAVDAKYKRYDLRRIASSDLYQLFLYAQAYRGFTGTPTALLVHPSETPQPVDRVDLRVAGLQQSSVATVPLQVPQLLDRIRSSATGRDQALADVRRTVEQALAGS